MWNSGSLWSVFDGESLISETNRSIPIKQSSFQTCSRSFNVRYRKCLGGLYQPLSGIPAPNHFRSTLMYYRSVVVMERIDLWNWGCIKKSV
jgi:hypothetical protein